MRTLTLIVLFIALLAHRAHADDATTLLPEACHVSGDFAQTRRIPDLDQALSSQGKFLFHCERGLLWHSRAPSDDLLIYGADGKHFSLHNGVLTALTHRGHDQLGALLNQLMRGDTATLAKHFEIHTEDSSVLLEAKKRRMKKFLHSIRIQGEAADREILLLHGNGSSTQIDILAPAQFESFDKARCAATFPAIACDTLAGEAP